MKSALPAAVLAAVVVIGGGVFSLGDIDGIGADGAIHGAMGGVPTDLVAHLRAALVTVEITHTDSELVDRLGGSVSVLKTTNGSGFFLDREGHILTNAHVVRNALSVVVLDSLGQRRAATVIARDDLSDLAVIRVGGDVPAVLAFRLDDVAVGEAVIAAGAPFGFAGTISTGIVSGLERGRRSTTASWYLQHTAMINPGSSGGPVVDQEGYVVGINAAVPDGQFEFNGIALAVNGRLAARVAPQLIAGGSISRWRLGVVTRDVDPVLRLALDDVALTGAIVEQVETGSPADLAGVRPNDIIVAANGVAIRSSGDLSRSMEEMRLIDPSRQATTLTVMRQGENRNISVPLEPVSAAPTVPATFTEEVGLTLQVSGPPMVAEVAPESLAASTGLVPGVLIHEVNLVPVSDAGEATERLAEAGLPVLLRISRNGEPSRLLVIGAERAANGSVDGNNLGVLVARH